MTHELFTAAEFINFK